MRAGFAVAGVVVVAFALLLPVHATGVGSVAGSVTLTAVRSKPLATSVYGRRGVPPKAGAVGPETRKVVVYLSNPKLAQASAPMQASIAQKDEQFVPHLVAVDGGIGGRVPERGSVLPQRVLAVARRRVQSRALSVGSSRSQRSTARHRQGVLRDPLAHERGDSRLRSRLVHGARRGRQIRDRRRAPPAITRSWRGTSASASAAIA